MEQFTIGESGVFVRGLESCWCCGKKPPQVKLTIHHGIPQTMNPIKNVEIPICEGCHDLINTQDVNQTMQFVFKLDKTAEELNKSMVLLVNQTQKAVSIIDKQMNKDEGGKNE